MNAVRFQTTIQGDTVRSPALKRLKGKRVDVIVLDSSEASQEKALSGKSSSWFKRNFGRGWPGSKKDGFENAVKKWRQEDKPRELPDA